MNAREDQERASHPYPQGELESPFLEEEIFVGEAEGEWQARLTALEAESAFQHAFEQSPAMPFEPEEPDEEFIAEEAWTETEDVLLDEAEDYDDEALAELEDGTEELYDEEESPCAEEGIFVGEVAITTILRTGDKGEDIRKLQRTLRDHGFDIGVDGDFGRNTRRAVRSFQEQNGLDADGIAGPITLAALGLDLDGSGSGGKDGDEGVMAIGFDGDVVKAVAVQSRIEAYVDRLADQNEAILDVTQAALAQFETTMSFASTSEANPDTIGAVLQKAFDFATGKVLAQIGQHVPGISIAVTAWKTASQELARAGKGATGTSIGDWIKDVRVVIDNARRSFHVHQAREEVALGFLESDDRSQFLDNLFAADELLRQRLVPPVSALELKLYETWINAHFRSIGANAPGCVEFRFDVDHEENAIEFVSCKVKAPAGDKIDGALNRLLDDELVPGFSRPIDLKVRKRACFRVKNLVDGRSWECGWLDAENNIFHQPVVPNAKRAIADIGWRMGTRRFRD